MSGMNLTNGETRLLAAVFTEMGDIPTLRYEEVAILAGIKFARNTRASLKRLFAKVKAAAGIEFADDDDEAGPSKDASEPDEDNENDEEEEIARTKAAPSKKQKKGVAVKKVAPRKRSGVTKRVTASRGKAISRKGKEPVNHVSDDNEVEEEFNDGKFIFLKFSSQIYKKNSSKASSITSKPEHQAAMSGNGTNAIHKTEEDDASFRSMTVEEWRAWKVEHNYDAYLSHCPTPVWCLSEEVA